MGLATSPSWSSAWHGSPRSAYQRPPSLWYGHNETGQHFWRRVGWKHRSDLVSCRRRRADDNILMAIANDTDAGSSQPMNLDGTRIDKITHTC